MKFEDLKKKRRSIKYQALTWVICDVFRSDFVTSYYLAFSNDSREWTTIHDGYADWVSGLEVMTASQQCCWDYSVKEIQQLITDYFIPLLCHQKK